MSAAILTLEKRDISSTELHDIMDSLKEKLEKRIKNKFFGSNVRYSLKNLSVHEQNKFVSEALSAYK